MFLPQTSLLLQLNPCVLKRFRAIGWTAARRGYDGRMASPRDLIGLPLIAPRALHAAADFLERLPAIESSVIGAVARAQGTLDELLDRVRPIETELQEVQQSAATLERQLAETEGQIAITDRKVAELQELMARLIEVTVRIEGAAEHVLDKVPGLSAERAEERADEIARETGA
jgi:septal ring factor EnvC (AmiA/AmiB activator)